MDAREILASRRVVLAAVGREINSGLQSSPRPVSVVRSSGAVREVEPDPPSQTLSGVCVTPVPLLALACYCRIPQRRRPRGQSQVLGACASQWSVEWWARRVP